MYREKNGECNLKSVHTQFIFSKVLYGNRNESMESSLEAK